MRAMTFGKKIAGGFAAMIALSILSLLVALYSLRAVIESKDRVIEGYGQSLVDAESLAKLEARSTAAVRGFLIDGSEEHAEEVESDNEQLLATLRAIKARSETSMEESLVADIEETVHAYHRAAARMIELRRQNQPPERIGAAFSQELAPRRDQQAEAIKRFVMEIREARGRALEQSDRTAAWGNYLLTGIAVVFVVSSIILATLLYRNLTKQIGTAVQQVQSSSAELQAASNQQKSAATEQATSMSEISTTITQLLATSRQIAEGARRVASVANQTTQSAQTGGGTMNKAGETFEEIRAQMGSIVGHMLDLGKQSQEIGTVVEIVGELAEQTNILAINATIEAAGAGEAGKRFAVVADEIRKLADRVADSAKEIRVLIDGVRSSVNTTVMATEAGSKAVDLGVREFNEASELFSRIAEMVTASTEASQEIELSTKQQTTAVEQVTVAIKDVSQAARETEASSSQTLQTASQLTELSSELLRFIKAA